MDGLEGAEGRSRGQGAVVGQRQGEGGEGAGGPQGGEAEAPPAREGLHQQWRKPAGPAQWKLG